MNLTDKFLKFEHENKLFDKKIQEVKYWHLIRYNLFRMILQNTGEQGLYHTSLASLSLPKKILIIIRQLSCFFIRNPSFNFKKKDLLVLNHPRRVNSGKYYDCIYTDEILNNISFSYCVLERAYLRKHLKPVRTKNLKYLDSIQLTAQAKVVLLQILKVYKLNHGEVESINNLTQKINDEFQCNINLKNLINMLKYNIFYYKAAYPLYNKLMDRISPRAVIEVVSYVIDNFIVTSVARSRSIPVLELQHGTIGKYHLPYNFYKNVKLEAFPDYILLFGEYWKNSARFPIEQSNCLVTGFPHYERIVKDYSEKSAKEKIVLFISQGSIGKELSKMAAELEKIIKDTEYRVIYKLHPGEYDRWRNEYPWLVNQNIKVVDNDDQSVYYYLSTAEVVVGVNSTAVFESMAFNPKIFIYKISGHQQMEELYANGYARLVSSAGDILENINEAASSSSEISTFFWEKDSISKISEALSSVIRQQQK
jgi:hypothetical protein